MDFGEALDCAGGADARAGVAPDFADSSPVMGKVGRSSETTS